MLQSRKMIPKNTLLQLEIAAGQTGYFNDFYARDGN